MEFNPPFIDVTYHREEYVYRELEGGYLKTCYTQAPWNCGICAAIQHKYNVDAIPIFYVEAYQRGYRKLLDRS